MTADQMWESSGNELLFMIFAIVTYIYLFPRLPLSHTHVHFSTQVEISAESTNFKNINKVTWIRIMRSNCDFYAKDEIVKVGL